jgi:methylase of polypeptide subunit release factors
MINYLILIYMSMLFGPHLIASFSSFSIGLELMSWMLLLLGRKAYALKFLKVIIQVMLMISSLKLLESDKYLSSWSVLDIGTGNGLLLHELAKQGYALRFC